MVKKKISFSTQRHRADIGAIIIYRILPNRYADAVGPFVFLDHMGPVKLTKEMKAGTGAHPHRGIATLTYILNGANVIPQMQLNENRGWLKVIAGAYEKLVSKIPSYSKQYLYHIHLNEEKLFSIPTEKGLEYAAFLPQHNIIINDIKFNAGDFIEFDREEGRIEISNMSNTATDIILFGVEKYAGQIVAQGPFIMNTQSEIAQAYNDFHAGKYGEIKYDQASV